MRQPGLKPMASSARALDNLAFVAGVNRMSTEGYTEFIGQNMVIDPRGHVLEKLGGEQRSTGCHGRSGPSGTRLPLRDALDRPPAGAVRLGCRLRNRLILYSWCHRRRESQGGSGSASTRPAVRVSFTVHARAGATGMDSSINLQRDTCLEPDS